jgi:putative ABC transport system permease protein
MYLAWKEIVHNKGRYSLVIVMVFLISYLVYFLTGLAYGLATSYTQAIDRFQADGLVLTEESNDNAMMSFVSDTQFDALSVSGKKAKLGILPGVIKDDSLAKSNIYFFGAEDSSFIWPQAISLSDSEVLMDSSLEKKGYAVGSTFNVVGTTKTLTVKGFIR